MGTFYIAAAILMAFLTGLGAGLMVVLGIEKQLKKDFTTVLMVLFCLCGGYQAGHDGKGFSLCPGLPLRETDGRGPQGHTIGTLSSTFFPPFQFTKLFIGD